MIRMWDGPEKPVEEIEVGDRVLTLDHGAQTVRWVGKKITSGQGRMAPICFRRKAFGNHSTLLVSPQHRMLVKNWHAELNFGEREVLVAAKQLVNDDTVLVTPVDRVTYVHVLFDSHEVVWANGCLSESFHPGHYGLTVMGAKQRDEILTLFPSLGESLSRGYGATARASLKGWEGRLLAAQMYGERARM
jgi:hypothetical protein